MESLQGLKLRKKAVQNISQITKAMEVVSATKMRRSQEIALKTRPYAHKALELLVRIANDEHIKIPFTQVRPVTRSLIVIVSSDKGLAGSFNTQVFRTADLFFEKDSHSKNFDHAFFLIAVGKKSMRYAEKKNHLVVDALHGFGDFVNPEEVEPLAQLVLNGFQEKKWDRVIIISTHFRTTLKQEVLVRQILPVDVAKIRETVREIIPEYGRYAEFKEENTNVLSSHKTTEYIFEPSPQKVLDVLIPHLLKMQLYQLVLEANASEHSARMVAMKNASSNADELTTEITLLYQKARQASITTELIEIVSTQNALTSNA